MSDKLVWVIEGCRKGNGTNRGPVIGLCYVTWHNRIRYTEFSMSGGELCGAGTFNTLEDAMDWIENTFVNSYFWERMDLVGKILSQLNGKSEILNLHV